MLDRKFIREHTEIVREGLAKKKSGDKLDAYLALDVRRRALMTEVEQIKAKRNEASEAIGRAKQAGEDASVAINEMKLVSQAAKAGDQSITEMEEELARLESWFPNLPDADVPVGGEDKNEVVRSWGEPRDADFEVEAHWDLGERLGILHTDAAAKMSGSGFSMLTGQGARLERALIQFFLDVHTTEHGYTEMNPPYLVRDHALFGTGQLPKLADDMYHTGEDGLWLIPTAEVSVTNMLREQILRAEDLPIRYVAFSPCFRREAGAAGKDTRGILRVHQFHKVEMVRFCAPDQSATAHEELVKNAETLLQRLELPYRVLKLATGDLSFAASKCYDLEVYSPGVKQWLEVSSCSNFGDFQARRSNIRYRPTETSKPEFIHTLNGSGLALPRIIVSILEHHQQADGRVRVPEVLRPYMGGSEWIGESA